ncbi:MAG TPA: dihydroorotase [Alphaproteobacteria bacterium]|nr:dihydroorotase [Alphaproteobacteria bacterium]
MMAARKKPQPGNGAMGRIAYVNARLIDPASRLEAKGALLIEGGMIADFGPKLFSGGVPDGIEVVDCKGLVLAPGLVDMRVQLREPGQEHKETLATASAAAAAGGVTTMACLPNTIPVLDEISLIEFVQRRARDVGVVNIYPYAAATKGMNGKDLTEMGLLAAAGAVGFTDATRTLADSVVMRRALSYGSSMGLLIVQHAEDPALAEGGAMNESELSTRLGLAGIPAAAEAIILDRDLRLVALTGGRYHAAHISTTAAVDAIRRAKAQGLNVTCDTAPPYFALNELAVGDYRTFAKVSPPLRSEEDRQGIVEGLKDGTIDAIASDHSPHDQDSKRLPFGQAEFGIIGLETLLPISLELYHNGHLPLSAVIGLLTYRPADVLALPAGRLKTGAPADLVLIDVDQPWRIEAAAFRSKSKNTPFDERPAQGRAVRTVVSGRTVFEIAA